MHTIPLSKDEYIGRHVTIRDCTDPTFQHEEGVIIDETKQTFLIQTDHGMKRIAKRIATFAFQQNGDLQCVDGSTICSRPEDRIKKTR
jgi:ribonuclease P protein subunit POP4